ncbi:MAG: 30S ribosomal protein S11 [Mycoplasmataceae bacterium]|nr:30S ribosomal protein S11 [Mycoplasmataceae bacterium]
MKNKKGDTKVKKRKKKLVVLSGIAHVHSTTNNTIISISDEQGKVISWASAGTIGYKGTKKSTPYAAGIAAAEAAKKAMNLGVKNVSIHINGTGQGKDTAMRSIQAAGLNITELIDCTPLPHNGCKPPKKPR